MPGLAFKEKGLRSLKMKYVHVWASQFQEKRDQLHVSWKMFMSKRALSYLSCSPDKAGDGQLLFRVKF